LANHANSADAKGRAADLRRCVKINIINNPKHIPLSQPLKKLKLVKSTWNNFLLSCMQLRECSLAVDLGLSGLVFCHHV
jgi:hypothetical protein